MVVFLKIKADPPFENGSFHFFKAKDMPKTGFIDERKRKA
jgi:hypothetical protein